MTLLHLALADELAECAGQPTYAPGGFVDEGFIHCCWPGQLVGVISRYYQGRADLILLELDRDALAAILVEENLMGGDEKFPHLYGEIPLGAIQQQFPLALDDKQQVVVPTFSA